MKKSKVPGYNKYGSGDLTVTVKYKNPPGPVLFRVTNTQDEIQSISLSIEKKGYESQSKTKVRILHLILSKMVYGHFGKFKLIELNKNH